MMIFKPIEWHFKGEHNETYNANAFTLKFMRVTMYFFLLAWVLDLLNIFIVDLQIMTTGLVGAAIILVLTYLYAYTKGIDSSGSRYVMLFGMIAMVTMICTEMAYHTSLIMIFPLICSMQYFDKRVTRFTWVITCIGCAVSVILGYKIGLCDANMLLLTYTNSAHHIAELTAGTFAINSNLFLIFLFFVFPRWLLFLAVMPILNHVARDIQKRAARETKALHLAETDGLTGLFNRNKYLSDLKEYYPQCNKVAVMFFDVNNLKITNDTLGHEYGDILLCGLADILKARESEECRSYRLGGDEFVMIATNNTALHSGKIYTELNEILHDRPLAEDVLLSVAIGTARGNGADIETLIKEADDKMYQNKIAMKQQREPATLL